MVGERLQIVFGLLQTEVDALPGIVFFQHAQGRQSRATTRINLAQNRIKPRAGTTVWELGVQHVGWVILRKLAQFRRNLCARAVDYRERFAGLALSFGGQ